MTEYLTMRDSSFDPLDDDDDEDPPLRPPSFNAEPGSKLFIILLIVCGFSAIAMLVLAAFER